jgi:uncharacterized protein YecT (DUF1311 family)
MHKSIVLLLALATLAHADDGAPAWLQRCGDGPQQQMNACMAEEYRQADARLNAVYGELTGMLENPSTLRQAQKAWLRFRDLSCEYETSGIGRDGSLYPYALAACRIGHTEQRIRELEQYLARDCAGCPPRK